MYLAIVIKVFWVFDVNVNNTVVSIENIHDEHDIISHYLTVNKSIKKVAPSYILKLLV